MTTNAPERSHVDLDTLQKYVEKEATAHLYQEDGSVQELTITIMKATVAGVPYKVKGKAGVELAQVTDFYEIDAAPVKPKAVTQKELDLVPEGAMRQHLADRHGVDLQWCKDATEQAAVEFHNTLDHTKLGHTHVDKAAKKAEREAKIAAQAGDQSGDGSEAASASTTES